MTQPSKTILVTGSQGFIGSFICAELLSHNCKVVGVDNYSKYGRIVRPHDSHPNFTLYPIDIAQEGLIDLVDYYKPNQVIAGAAMIGGISYFHELPYDLLAANERITANTFDACIAGHREGYLEKIIVMSSSMIYETCTTFPLKEEYVKSLPLSSYGFQKLATEYYAKAAWDQYGLPYTIIRPFNCVGIGEDKAICGNDKFNLSHVLPDLVQKIWSGMNPVPILGDGSQVRCFTNGKDIAQGIWLAMNNEQALNETFNISTSTATPILELAQLIWDKLKNEPFAYVSETPFKHDVKYRVPDTSKAEKILGFKAKITLSESIDEVIKYQSKIIP